MRHNVGVFGGSFNPIHVGHLILAQDALEEFELDQVLFVPCAIPPHKNPYGLVEPHHRLAMVGEAIGGDPRFEVSDIELERSGVSYTIDTVEQLQRRHPENDYVFIIGSDSVFELHTWKEIDRLLKRCAFVVMARPGFSADALTSESTHLDDPWPARLAERVCTGHLIEISSSEIRMRVAEGLSISYLVDDAVGRYIAEHNLYV